MNASINPPKVIGHRGAAGHAPENTLASIQKAFDLGVTWVEVDVKLSGDGEPILLHDDLVDRTTNGKGAAKDMTLAELKALDAGAWFGASFAGIHIPTLVELLVVLVERNMGVNLELKPSAGTAAETGRAVALACQDMWPENLPPPIISSFKTAALAGFADVMPAWERALLVHKLPDDWLAQADSVGATAMHCNQRHIKRHQVDAIRAADMPVRCFTVNDAANAERLYHWGVESLFTDFPERLL